MIQMCIRDRDKVIRPAILWNDGRTGEETDYLNQVIGKDKLSEYTANIAFAGFTAPKILWMKNKDCLLYTSGLTKPRFGRVNGSIDEKYG